MPAALTLADPEVDLHPARPTPKDTVISALTDYEPASATPTDWISFSLVLHSLYPLDPDELWHGLLHFVVGVADWDQLGLLRRWRRLANRSSNLVWSSEYISWTTGTAAKYITDS